MTEQIQCKGPGDMGGFHARLAENIERAKNDPEFLKELTEEREGNPITLGPRVAKPEDWAKDMVDAAKAKAAKWLKNSLAPKKDPKERALKAATKFKNKMQAALDADNWPKGIAAYDETVRQETIKATDEAGYRSGIDRKKAKIDHKIKKLQPLVAALTATIDLMPVDTPEQRAAKMVAARDGMLTIKEEMRK